MPFSMEQMRIQNVVVPKQRAEEEVEVEPLEEQPEVVKLHPRAVSLQLEHLLKVEVEVEQSLLKKRHPLRVVARKAKI